MTKRSSGPWIATALGLVVVLGVGNPATAADATGTWKWTVERNGNTIETTLKLKQDGEKVSGTITGRQGNETEIEEGKVKDGAVSFEVTREFNGNKFVMTYTGKLSGDSIKGETKFERDGEGQSREREAQLAK